MNEGGKDKLLALARSLAKEEGLGALTIRRLAEEGGVSIGTVYNRFASKEELLVYLIDDYWQGALEKILSYEESKSLDALENLDRIYQAFREETRNFHKDWIRNLVGFNMESQAIRQLTDHYKGQLEEEIGRVLRKDPRLSLASKAYMEDLSSFIFENMELLLRKDREDLGFFREILRILFEEEKHEKNNGNRI